MVFDSPAPIEQSSEIEELSGKLSSQDEEDKLMHSVLEADPSQKDKGKLISEAANYGSSSFTPDLLFEKLVQNYSLAKQIVGESFLRLASGYNPEYIEKNINIPEFRKDLKKRLEEKFNELQEEGLLDSSGTFTEKGITLGALVMYTEELDYLFSKGVIGQRVHKEHQYYGARNTTRPFAKGDRYRDIALKSSIKRALRRGHTELSREDLHSFEREGRGNNEIIYAIDASGSMKGKKLEAAKKAGIALAYKAIEQQDKVGIIIFGSDVKGAIAPTKDFMRLLKGIANTKASRETNFVKTIHKAKELFTSNDATKHLILITDALPTKGDDPKKETCQEVAVAQQQGITTSLIGIQLNDEGKELGEEIAMAGKGHFQGAKNLEDIDIMVIEEYNSFS